MAAYHVFVEGSVDPSPDGLERLASAIADHYGLPVASLRTRIATGRFRVKGNCDRETADLYVRDLTRLGARCAIEEASPQNRADTPLPFPAVRPGTPPPVAPTPPARPSTPLPVGGYQSGLSAAFSGAMPAASLGALEGGGESFSLGSVDGKDDEAPPDPAAFGPPDADDRGGQSASIGPAPAKKPGKPAKPKDQPLDMFAPPDAADDALNVDLAPDEIERSAHRRASTPVIEAPIAEPAPSASSPAMRRSQPSIQPPNVTHDGPRGLGDPKLRFALGIVIAIVLGFVPAHLIASMREHSAFEEIDRKVLAKQESIDTDDAYAALDKFRDEQLGRKHEDRRNIAITALLMWALAGGAIGYVWFRRIPWDRFET